jgi:hypothetical protein
MDILSKEIRLAEQQIDAVYESNPLTRLSFAKSVWHVMVVIEDHIFSKAMGSDELTRFGMEPMIDHYMSIIRRPMFWLRMACSPGGEIPRTANADHYRSAEGLLTLASEYQQFVTVFTHASRGLISLQLKGDTLLPSHVLPKDSRYEAYNRLIKPLDKGLDMATLFAGLDEIYARLLPTLVIDRAHFSYDLNPSIVKFTMDASEQVNEQRFSLPDIWRFSRYALSDFKRVYHAVLALAHLQFCARNLAAKLGCENRGLADSVRIVRKYELLNRLARYTGLGREIIRDIISDITFGANQISASKADPTDQPLILLNDDQYVIAPNLWINNAAERNFVVLLNKMPEERDAYLSFVHLKEEVMRERMVGAINNKSWRTWFGTIPGGYELPDIDLAVIDSNEKICIVIELKWFIDPAEARELIEKSEEIEKGVSQLSQLRRAFIEHDKRLLDCLQIDSSYKVAFVLVSENWIGDESEQVPEIPVIREYHLTQKLMRTDGLSETITWLTNRSYLPRENVHYRVVETQPTVGKWKTHWYGLDPLIKEDHFLPL